MYQKEIIQQYSDRLFVCFRNTCHILSLFWDELYAYKYLFYYFWTSMHGEISPLKTASTVICVRESTKPILCNKWGHFDSAKPILRILLASWSFKTVEKGFRSFNAENLGSLGQRTAKLLAIKLWKWFDFARNRTRADWPTGAGARWQTFFWDLRHWQLVTLQPFDLQTPYW